MGFKIKGVINSISEKKTLDNGASVLDYVVHETSENGYVTAYNFNIYKKPEYAEIIDKFITYNKIGDQVEVEFNIRSNEYNGRIYNSLSHWDCKKINNETKENVNQENQSQDDGDGLPF